LHADNRVHISPITGKSFRTNQEINMLHALIDQVWDRTDRPGKQALEAQRAKVDRAYEPGSRAKTPSSITRASARKTVILTYQVAKCPVVFPGRKATGNPVLSGQDHKFDHVSQAASERTLSRRSKLARS
jgi:hypothetical protein